MPEIIQSPWTVEAGQTPCANGSLGAVVPAAVGSGDTPGAGSRANDRGSGPPHARAWVGLVLRATGTGLLALVFFPVILAAWFARAITVPAGDTGSDPLSGFTATQNNAGLDRCSPPQVGSL